MVFAVMLSIPVTRYLIFMDVKKIIFMQRDSK